MKKTAFIITLILWVSNSFSQSQEILNYHPNDSITSLVVDAGNDLRIAANHMYVSMGAYVLSSGFIVGSILLPEDASRDGSGNMVLRVLGYGSALVSTVFMISSVGHLKKAGISLSEYGLGIKVPIK